MFAASPGLHAVEHPIYDVWITDCKGGQAPTVADAPEAKPGARQPQQQQQQPQQQQTQQRRPPQPPPTAQRAPPPPPPPTAQRTPPPQQQQPPSLFPFPFLR
jgi:hypothetical protein